MYDDEIDPRTPFLDEIAVVRALLGSDLGEWPTVQVTLSPCLKLIFDIYSEKQLYQRQRTGAGVPRLVDLLDELEHLSTVQPDLEDLRNAPILDQWSAGVGTDGCARLFGRVTGHPLIRQGARIYTSPYLQVDPEAGCARTWSRWYRLARYDRGFLGELILDGVVGPSTRPIEM
jgi:hypothetical protein